MLREVYQRNGERLGPRFDWGFFMSRGERCGVRREDGVHESQDVDKRKENIDNAQYPVNANRFSVKTGVRL